MYIYTLSCPTCAYSHAHTHTHIQSLDWCIESASLLSEYDIITTNPGSIDPDVVKQEFDQFLLECPAPSQEDLQELLELMESTESIWSRDNAAFAHNRVLEIIERFCYYHKELEKLLAQRKEEEKKEAAIRKDFVKKTKRVVRAVDSLISRVSDVALQVGGDLDSSQDASTGTEDESFDETDASQHRPPHAPVKKPEKQGSLHYEDLDEALMLLESAAQSASNRLDSQRAAPPLIAIEGGDLVRLRVHSELSETHQEHRVSPSQSQPCVLGVITGFFAHKLVWSWRVVRKYDLIWSLESDLCTLLSTYRSSNQKIGRCRDSAFHARLVTFHSFSHSLVSYRSRTYQSQRRLLVLCLQKMRTCWTADPRVHVRRMS